MSASSAVCTKPSVSLFTSQQVYAIEQAWFDHGYDSFALMQQAAWQIAQTVLRYPFLQQRKGQKRANIWVGQGNNGGDGWLVAMYLQQAGWQVQVITVGAERIAQPHTNQKNIATMDISDAQKARQMALTTKCPVVRFEDDKGGKDVPSADIYIDALFGIGLDRAPSGSYQQAIEAFNQAAVYDGARVVAVDIPSGLVASTGQVFERCAIKADITLCLVARKLGLHTKDGMDYAGSVKDIALIPYDNESAATLLMSAYPVTARLQNSYKGSYGHVLIIGGNRIDGSQGMGGAAILAASSAMAVGAGKITVACHDAFHEALLTSLPDAMTIDLHDKEGVSGLIEDASVIAIGMGLGRDDKAKDLFITYVQAAMAQKVTLIIDADGLYHLASLQTDNHKLVDELKDYSRSHTVCLTPHSGEAARLLDKKITAVEADRLAAITQCHKTFGGNWVLKGAGSLVWEDSQVYVCSTGNAGMASAGMGDVLSGLIAGLMAQEDLGQEGRSLRQAVMVHGQAGDTLVELSSAHLQTGLQIGQRGLQAQDMPAAIRHVMQTLITDG